MKSTHMYQQARTHLCRRMRLLIAFYGVNFNDFWTHIRFQSAHRPFLREKTRALIEHDRILHDRDF